MGISRRTLPVKNAGRFRGFFAAVLAGIFLTPSAVHGAVAEYELTLDLRPVNVTGRPVEAMTINGGIPGPVLRFREGDTARIRVRNNMPVDTSIHWHGLLLPNEMDGVPFVTQPPIPANSTFTYEFNIRQTGTYWYHSHTRLQEQRGVYGAIVITPADEPNPPPDDHVVVLSDWTDRLPEEVLRLLKRGSEWFSIEKRSGQSVLGAARLGLLGDYFKRELQRMPAMDISDVAYDRFLANGRPEYWIDAAPGETVRIRIVDGSASSFFHLNFSGGPMTIVSADGQPVLPLKKDIFLIGVAETYDVLVTVPESGKHELRATSHDGTGFASVWIGRGERRPARTVPIPNVYHAMGKLTLGRVFALTPAGTMGMADPAVENGELDEPVSMMDRMMRDMDHGSGSPMDGGNMDGPMEMEKKDARPASGSVKTGGFLLRDDVASASGLARDGMSPLRPWPPYAELRSPVSTAFSSTRPVRQVRLTLDGDMERYVWKIDNRTIFEEDSILIKKGEIVRFILINRTMMHHPMHLHGHFFRVVGEQGDHSPLKHTVDVPPMSTTVIEFDAEEFGDWFFHCHLLYHMKSGMARVVHYRDFVPSGAVRAVRPRLTVDHWYAWADADVLSNMTLGKAVLSNSNNMLTAEWQAGWENTDRTEWEIVPLWNRVFNRFSSVFIGADIEGEGGTETETRAVAGAGYVLPLNIHFRGWIDEDGGARAIMEKEFMLTPRFELAGEAEYDTHHKWEGRVGLSYLATQDVSLVTQWHSEFSWGLGARIRF
ncbi:MAG: multicopper oxidase domain-containing protein [Elusimicrobiales bacterium]|nr:multicopper oxidase domain-containing protein [Elusimicrobiales bacterium]